MDIRLIVEYVRQTWIMRYGQSNCRLPDPIHDPIATVHLGASASPVSQGESCPWCQSPAEFCTEIVTDGKIIEYVRCTQCKATGPQFMAMGPRGAYDDAVRAWNTRIVDKRLAIMARGLYDIGVTSTGYVAKNAKETLEKAGIEWPS